MSKTGFVRNTICAIAAVALAVASLAAQEQTSIVLILDPNSIDIGAPPHQVPPELANVAIAGPGLREELPYFAAHTGEQAAIQTGAITNSGLFALRTVAASWESEPGTQDGLQNFVLAGPGVGSPDATGDRESQLRQVADVVPLQAAGLAMLVGRQVCGVVYNRQITVVPGNPTDLSGPTLGIFAFKVLGLIEPQTSTALPGLAVEILEAHEDCHRGLTAFADVPDPNQH